MHDDELDDLLRRAGTTTGARAATLDRLVDGIGARRSARRLRRPAVVALTVAGTVLLAAAATTGAWQRIPPFQGLDQDMFRTRTAIPVDFTMTSGQPVRCQAFLEYVHLSVAQSEQAERYVRQHGWTGLGQRLYDSGAPASETYEHAQDRIHAALEPVLETAAADAVPEAAPRTTDTDGARISGWSAICRRAAR